MNLEQMTNEELASILDSEYSPLKSDSMSHYLHEAANRLRNSIPKPDHTCKDALLAYLAEVTPYWELPDEQRKELNRLMDNYSDSVPVPIVENIIGQAFGEGYSKGENNFSSDPSADIERLLKTWRESETKQMWDTYLKGDTK